MDKRIKDKIKEIKNYLDQLSKIVPKTFEEYEKDFKTKAACERYFEKITESILDIIILVIREKNLTIPEHDYELFNILEKEGIINQDIAKKLKNIKGMRNVIIHQYGDVDDELMYVAISKELNHDVQMFLKIINKNFNS